MANLKKALQIITIVVLFCIIAMPLVFFHTEAEHVLKVENKMAATRPELDHYNLFSKELVSDFEQYLNDNIGLKEEATLTYIGTLYRLFDKIGVTNYLEGKDDNLFYLSDEIIKIYQGRDELSAEQMAQVEEHFRTLDTAVREYGSQLIFMPIPNKEEIYPELMPDSIKIASENSMFSSIKNHLENKDIVAVADVEDALLAQKEQQPLLYYKNHDPSHWNMLGAYYGYLELMHQMQAVNAGIQYVTEDDITILSEEVHLPFNHLAEYEVILEAFTDMEDMVYSVSAESGNKGKLDNSVPTGFAWDRSATNRYFHYQNENAMNETSVLIYGDSYIYTFLLPLLSETFSDVYFLHIECTDEELMQLLQYTDPEFIVFESVSRTMNYDHLLMVTSKLMKALDNNLVIN